MALRRNKNKLESVNSEIEKLYDLEKLTDEQWRELYLRLRYFTYSRYKTLATTNSVLEDFIHDSIKAALSGERHRPPEIPIFKFICGIITSKTSHYFAQESNRARLNADPRISKAQTINDYLERENLRLDLSSVMEKIKNEIKDKNDAELYNIHQAITEDPNMKPSEIAESYNVSIGKVKNALKRYVRLVKKILPAY